MPTRGVKASTLAENKLWFKGPPWLGKTIDHWPKSRPEPNLDLVANERRKLIMSVSVVKVEGIQKIVDLNRSNSLDKMLRVTAYVLRFVRSAKGLGKTTGPITADELKTAELKFVRDIQREEYRTELKSLEKGEKVHPSSKIASLSPIISEGIICLGGRLGEAVDLTYNEKHPIILGKLFRISKLLMIRSHSQVKHGGIADTTTQLRERYWLTAGRQLARTIVKDCTICKRFKAKLGEVPTAPLPSDRISENPAFSIIGVDFFGPLHIKIKGDNITQKAYVLLTTCAVSRAVHLEIVPSLSTHEFLLAFRRVIARRGVPSIVYSDNALTFKKADKELKKIWENLNDAEIKNFFGNQGIKWKYIVERAAWYGGWWERLVRSCKNSPKKTIGKANLYYSEMETILSETEAIINSRPISYNYNDPNEPTPLCPADLIIGRRLTSLPPLTFKENVPINQKQFKIREKHREQIMQRIWRKWRHDYLMELRSAHHANPHKTNSTLFKIGDVVVIYDDNSPRQMWKLGIVKEIILGRDNKIRACIVKNSKGSEIKRSVQHLANLEILE